MTEQTASPKSNVSTDVDNAHTVEVFLAALQDKDLDTAGAQLDANLVYENVGFPTIHGRARAIKLFRGMQRPFLGLRGEDPPDRRQRCVGAHRAHDVLVVGPLRMQFWVCGVFEVHSGRITLWRDYFDMFDFTKAFARGVVGVVVPALRPRL